MVRYRYGANAPTRYDKGLTRDKVCGAAATVTSSAVVAFALIHLARANLSASIVLWPEWMDEPIAITITAGLSAAWRGVMNYRKHGRE